VGTVEDPTSVGSVMVARYLPTGALDTSFGTGGVSIKQVGQAAANNFSGTTDPTEGQAVALTPSGDIIVPTLAANSDPAGGTEVAVLDFTPTGDLNPHFGTGGVYYDDTTSTTAPHHASAFGVAVQSDGKIVITGEADGTPDDTVFVRRLKTD